MLYKYIGVVRVLGGVALFSIISFLADAQNAAVITPIVGQAIAVVITGLAAYVEHSIEDKSGKALFGAVDIRA